MFQGFYINLDRDRERRSLLEQQLEETGHGGKYARFPAIDGKTITYGPEAAPGTAILGCLLSHLSILSQQLHSGEHVHLIEDDAVLHRDIGRVFETFINHEQTRDWDILMTDTFLPPDVYLFKLMHQKYREFAGTGTISFLDIGDWEFAGTSSYFVNDKSKLKILQMAEHGFKEEIPYDIRLRTLAKNRQLKIYLCFPFFSTLSETCYNSTFGQDTSFIKPLLEYRRSFYVDANLPELKNNLAADHQLAEDEHTEIYLNLIKTLIQPKYVPF